MIINKKHRKMEAMKLGGREGGALGELEEGDMWSQYIIIHGMHIFSEINRRII